MGRDSRFQSLMDSEGPDPDQSADARRKRTIKLIKSVLDCFEGNQSSLARTIGVRPGTVSVWTRGTEPRAHYWAKMAYYAGLTQEQALAYIAGEPIHQPNRLNEILSQIRSLSLEELFTVIKVANERCVELTDKSH